MKKVLSIILALTLVVLCVACGGNSSAPAASAPAASAPAASAPANSAPAASTPANAEKKVIIAGTGLTETHYGTVSLEKMKEYLEANTDTLTVEIYPNQLIGADKDVMEAMLYGTATMCIPTPAVVSNFCTAYNLLSLPFIFQDADSAHNLLDGEWGQALMTAAESAGYKVLGIGDYGFRQVTTSKKQLTCIDDYKGLKMRTMQSDLYIAIYNALGANPTPMASGEVFTALQQNVVDGQENPLSNIYSQKYNEVQKYILKDNHVCDFLIFAFSKEFYDGLTADEQAALQKAVDIAVDYTREQCAAADAECEELMKNDLVITEITPEFREDCINAVADVRASYGEAADPKLYADLMKALGY